MSAGKNRKFKRPTDHLVTNFAVSQLHKIWISHITMKKSNIAKSIIQLGKRVQFITRQLYSKKRFCYVNFDFIAWYCLQSHQDSSFLMISGCTQVILSLPLLCRVWYSIIQQSYFLFWRQYANELNLHFPRQRPMMVAARMLLLYIGLMWGKNG